MSFIYADDYIIQAVLREQLELFYARRRGPKRYIETLLPILLPLSHHALGGDSLTTKEIRELLPDMNENTLEDNLAFLRKFPVGRPFLLMEKRHSGEKKKGAPKNTYKFDRAWLAHTGKDGYSMGGRKD